MPIACSRDTEKTRSAPLLHHVTRPSRSSSKTACSSAESTSKRRSSSLRSGALFFESGMLMGADVMPVISLAAGMRCGCKREGQCTRPSRVSGADLAFAAFATGFAGFLTIVGEVAGILIHLGVAFGFVLIFAGFAALPGAQRHCVVIVLLAGCFDLLFRGVIVSSLQCLVVQLLALARILRARWLISAIWSVRHWISPRLLTRPAWLRVLAAS